MLQPQSKEELMDKEEEEGEGEKEEKEREGKEEEEGEKDEKEEEASPFELRTTCLHETSAHVPKSSPMRVLPRAVVRVKMMEVKMEWKEEEEKLTLPPSEQM